MAPIRYSLHYEDYSEHLMSRFGKLLQMQSLVDMTLMCSSHTLRVHKAVLAASSAYFQEVLQKQTGEPLIILKMRFNVLKCLVEFMYCGKTQCLEENLDELVSAAQFLKIKGLSKVTKEGLGITGNTELPVFTPPVVINRPPQSLIDLHSQDISEVSKPPPPQMTPATNANQPDGLGRINKDMVVRIPFDIESGGGSAAADYDPQRVLKPRRGRPCVRRSGWEGMSSVSGGGSGGGAAAGGAGGVLGRAAERALLRREQDSRKAIHQLKHLQTRQMQEYMDRVTLSQAVSSICGPESSTSNYMNLDNDLMYMDQTVNSNTLDSSLSFSKSTMSSETITSSYPNPTTSSATEETTNAGMGTAMSQYVSALKNAGLPTDLPILFESSDGSYINVNEQVLLDMVQSNEIQYEVIEQPNIIEKVADPSEIKSIDDLSKSIERGEVMMGSKSYSTNDYGKDNSEFSRHEEAINSLNEILPDNLESFADQQNYVVLDPRMHGDSSSLDHQNNNDFSSCIDSDMQFFTKSMSDDVKKYYDQQLSDSREMERLCPGSTSLDTNFSMSLLDTKSHHLSENMGQQYNLEDLRRTDDCYDFGLPLPQGPDFKDDALDCLMATPKATDDERHNYTDNKTAAERDAIIKDLMNLENNMSMTDNPCNANDIDKDGSYNPGSFNDPQDKLNLDAAVDNMQDNSDITPSTLQWNDMDNSKTDSNKLGDKCLEDEESLLNATTSDYGMENNNSKHDIENALDEINEDMQTNKENITNVIDDSLSMSQENIPFAVGLLPFKQVQPTEDNSLLKRKIPIEDDDMLDNLDAKCLKRKLKHKKL